jgi:glutaminyl-tRNA synthetase
VPAELRLYDRLFTVPAPGNLKGGGSYADVLNPESLVVAEGVVEPELARRAAGERFQFERTGYFCVDADSTAERPVFNRTITLRDTWARLEAEQQGS